MLTKQNIYSFVDFRQDQTRHAWLGYIQFESITSRNKKQDQNIYQITRNMILPGDCLTDKRPCQETPSQEMASAEDLALMRDSLIVR